MSETTPIVINDDQFGKWIESLHAAHDSTANIMVDEDHTDSLAHNILHSTLIQVCVGLYHRLQDLEEQVETDKESGAILLNTVRNLEKSTYRQSELDNEWAETELMSRDRQIERLESQLHQLRDDHDYRINEVDRKVDNHTSHHPTGRGYY